MITGQTAIPSRNFLPPMLIALPVGTEPDAAQSAYAPSQKIRSAAEALVIMNSRRQSSFIISLLK
jgi:hypothetical protein